MLSGASSAGLVLLPVLGLGFLVAALSGSEAPGRSGLELFEAALIEILGHTKPTIPYGRVSRSFGELSIPRRQLAQLTRIRHVEASACIWEDDYKAPRSDAFDVRQAGLRYMGASRVR
jgi:hypothetical protein